MGEPLSQAPAPESRGGLPGTTEPPRFAPPPLGRIAAGVAATHQTQLQAVLSWPELAPLSAGLNLDVDPSLATPFRVEGTNGIRLHPDGLVEPAVAAVLLRHACELTILRALAPGSAAPGALSLLAARTAADFQRFLARAEREQSRLLFPEALQKAYDRLTAKDSEPQEAGALIEALAGLTDGEAEPEATAAWSAYRSLLPLAGPSEQLLVTGGDPRVALDPETGLNGYGIGPAPRPEAIALSSSTASTISASAFAAVEQRRRALLAAAWRKGLDAALAEERERLRQGIAGACGIAPGSGIRIILTPSGTDAELHALALAGATEGRPLLNVVVAPDETGSGVPRAAAGQHFAKRTSLGVAVEPGSRLAGFDGGTIRTASLAVREADGRPRDPEALDRELTRLVGQAAGKGERVLVHLLDSAKTGLGAPRLQTALALRAGRPEAVTLLVDACQMRAASERLAGYLDAGCLVMVTGSKFFTGPAFSGALLVPAAIAARAGPLPAGLADYAGRGDYPADWGPAPEALPEQPAPGPLLRWEAALWEERAFAAVAPETQQLILQALGATARQAIEASDLLTAVPAPLLDRDALGRVASWDRCQTIIPFVVLDPEQTPFALEPARRIYQWANRDLSDRAPTGLDPADQAVLARACHLGQPVKLAHQDGTRAGVADAGALRLCLSARTVSRTALDQRRGVTLEARLERARREIMLALRKIELIAIHFDHFAGA